MAEIGTRKKRKLIGKRLNDSNEQPVDMNKVEKETVSRFNLKGAHSLCHYVIKDNQVIVMQ